MLNPPDGVTIRTALPEDAARLAALSDQLGYAVHVADLAQRLDLILRQPDSVLYVAESPDGEVIGWVHAFIRPLLTNPLHIEIGGLVVDERCRSQGVGAALMQHAEDWAREHGCDAVYLRSRVQREAAHRFYQRIGYTNLKTSYTFYKPLGSVADHDS